MKQILLLLISLMMLGGCAQQHDERAKAVYESVAKNDFEKFKNLNPTLKQLELLLDFEHADEALRNKVRKEYNDDALRRRFSEIRNVPLRQHTDYYDVATLKETAVQDINVPGLDVKQRDVQLAIDYRGTQRYFQVSFQYVPALDEWIVVDAHF